MWEISKSCTLEQVTFTRKFLLEQGYTEVSSPQEAEKLEAEGKQTFIDHAKGGAESFSREEMDDFRRTDCTVPGAFAAHERRFGK